MTVIQLTQVLNKHDLNEITTFRTCESFERINRVFAEKAKDDEPLQVWIDQKSEDGTDLIGDPIKITASQAKWFLKEFFHTPKSVWGKIKLN